MYKDLQQYKALLFYSVLLKIVLKSRTASPVAFSVSFFLVLEGLTTDSLSIKTIPCCLQAKPEKREHFWKKNNTKKLPNTKCYVESTPHWNAEEICQVRYDP